MPAKKATQNKFSKIEKPVLKRRKLKPMFEETNKNNLPEISLPNMDDFTNLSYDAQTAAYNVIKKMFVALRENQVYMDEQSFNDAYANLFFELINLGVTGNVAAMDYLCYIYKKGIDGMLYPNLSLAHKWGMLAIANGSKLALDRLRMFLNPVFDYLDANGLDVDRMLKGYDVLPENAIYFVSQTFACMYNPKMNITLLNMAKEDPTTRESNFTKFNIDSCKVRDSILPDLLKYLD